MISREAIMAALETRLRDYCPSARTVSRRLLTWDDVAQKDQPAIFALLAGQGPSYRAMGGPPVWTVKATLYVYCHHDPVLAGPELATMLDEIEGALEWKQGEVAAAGDWQHDGPGLTHNTTLGGLVQYARIVGDIQTDEGSLGDQQVAVLTVEMRAVA